MVLADAVVATLAVGPRYSTLAAAFLHEFVQKGNAALVVTDCPDAFDGSGVEVIPYRQEASSIWHAKRHVVREGLERAWTVYFMDGDHYLLEGWRDRVPKLQRLPIGAGVFFRTQTLEEIDFNFTGRLTQAEQVEYIDDVAEYLDIPNWRKLLWWGDWLFAVTRDTEDYSGVWPKFIETWNRFASWSAGKSCPELALGDGVAMAFAAEACGWHPQTRNEAFSPIVRAFRHMFCGDWRQKYKTNARP